MTEETALNSTNRSLFLRLLFTKLVFQNFILGFILSLMLKQFFALYLLSFFGFIEGSLAFVFMLGILSAGYLSENQGRKFLSSVSWVILSIILVLLNFATSVPFIWVALACSFFAVGIFITVFPIYVAECAPHLQRGSWVESSFLALLLGVSTFAMVDFNYQLSSGFWYLVANVLSIIALVLNHYMSESPSWLLEQSRLEEARMVLAELRDEEDIEKEMAVTRSSIRRRPRSWQQIYERQLQAKLTVSRYLAIFRQLTGIGVMLFYLPSLFAQRWSIDPAVLWVMIFMSLSSGLLFSAVYVDSVGRRKLTTISFFFQGAVLVALALSWKLNLPTAGFNQVLHEIILLLSFLFFFALGSGPVTWLSWIELMPLRSRARHIATFLLMTLVLGILIWLGYYFLINLVDIRVFYFIVGAFAFIAAIYCWQKMPETKSYLLDEI